MANLRAGFSFSLLDPMCIDKLIYRKIIEWFEGDVLMDRILKIISCGFIETVWINSHAAISLQIYPISILL